MSDITSTPATPTAPVVSIVAPTASPAPVAPVAPATAPAEDVASLPAWAQKMLKDTREEAAKGRTEAKKAAADEARALLAQEVGKALGLIETPDPAAAAKVTADERDAARQEARAIKVENAVLKMAGKHGANPEALTDSRSFMTTLATLDPAAPDFAVQVETAIKAAVEANPLLKLAGSIAPAPRSGGPVNGGAPLPNQLTREDLKGMSHEDILKADAEGRLNQIKGTK
jgi:hypothetical protein